MSSDRTIQAGIEGGMRNENERLAMEEFARAFDESPDSTSAKLASFPKYVRQQEIVKFLARYEIFKQVLHVKGSVIECGVFRGFGLFTWANLSALMEPTNLMRRIYGFDSFAGFPSVSAQDDADAHQPTIGELEFTGLEELQSLVKAYDLNRPLGHVDRVHLVPGDATKTMPAFLKSNPHLVVSLLFLDFDLFEPTKVALETFVPRMPKGAILAFDELDNPAWPGETLATLESVGLSNLRLQRAPFDPYVSYAIID